MPAVWSIERYPVTLSLTSFHVLQDIKEMRRVDNFDRRFSFAKECKQRGNDHYKDLDYDGAINEYERCLSLFEWIDPTDPDWKNKVILHCVCMAHQKITCLLKLSYCASISGHSRQAAPREDVP